LDETEGVKPEVGVILSLIAEQDAVLATGHLSPEESLTLLKMAQRCGIKRMVVTHASESVTALSPDQQREAVALGALIEHCLFAVTDMCPDAVTVGEIRDQIRHVGVNNVIVSSDFGQEPNGPPVAGFAHYLEKLHQAGLSGEEIRVMISDNPKRLLEKRKRLV